TVLHGMQGQTDPLVRIFGSYPELGAVGPVPVQITVYFFKDMSTVFLIDHPDEMLQVYRSALRPYIPSLPGCRVDVQYFNGLEICYKYGLCCLFGKITEYVVGKIPGKTVHRLVHWIIFRNSETARI